MFLNNKIAVLPSFCIGSCISLLIIPIPWVASWFIAGLIHELGHLIALKILRVPVLCVTLGFNGAVMETGCLQPRAEFLSALAGPLAGLSCLLFYSQLPLLAICGLVQSGYNLLPFPDHDGGRLLRILIAHYLSAAQTDVVYRWIIIVCAGIMIIFGLYTWFVVKLGPIFLVILTIPILKSGIIKIPCKGRK